MFFCSLSAISFEIALTRIFSISLWYHFAFLVVSMAMLGIGLSGTVLAMRPKPSPGESGEGLYALLLSISIPASYVLANFVPFDPVRLAWDRLQIIYIGLYYVILSGPFFFFGLIMSSLFSRHTGKSALIYGADLLGAGAGSVVVIVLMGWLPPGESVLVISTGAAAGAFIMGKRKSAAAVGIILLALLVLRPGFLEIRMSEYKGLRLALKYPGAELIKTYYSAFSRVDVFHSPMVRYAPGLSLKYPGALPEQLGLSIDGSGIDAITSMAPEGVYDPRRQEVYDPRRQEVYDPSMPSEEKEAVPSFLRYLPSALLYELGLQTAREEGALTPPRRALIVEPKGGLPVLLAREYGVRDITAAESNPVIVDVLGKDFKSFAGHIYDERTLKGLARSRLRGSAGLFDIIDISLLGAVPPGFFGIAEDYRFTVEAFKEYFGRLDGDGLLGISLYILPPPRTELRMLTTVIRAMEETGVKDVSDRIAAIRTWGTVCILIKASPLSPVEIETVRGFSRRMGFDIVYYPGVREEETNFFIKMPSSGYYDAFMKIIDGKSRASFIKGYVFDIGEVRDERPFFHHYLRFGNIKETYAVMGGKWQYFLEEGYLLPAVLAQALALSLIILLLPALKKSPSLPDVTGLSYFAFLGLGYMFVEVPLIQKMILPLENPSYALAVVLASVLISSGAGSLSSERFGLLRKPHTVLALSASLVPYGFFLSRLTGSIAALPLPPKIIISFCLISPVGFLMGIPFPLGMKTMGVMPPWAWAVNGCFSVIAPVLAVMLAMSVGFSGVFLLGAVWYAGAFLVLRYRRQY